MYTYSIGDSPKRTNYKRVTVYKNGICVTWFESQSLSIVDLCEWASSTIIKRSLNNTDKWY